MDSKFIENITIDEERAFYSTRNATFNHINISGPADGESAFKECRDIVINNSNFDLRYPCWHVINLKLENCTLQSTARAAFWYDENIDLNFVNDVGIKSLRECNAISISNSRFVSDEICWRCKDITITSSEISGEYAFFESKDIIIQDLQFVGKYSFQYVDKMLITNSNLDTKDAFWHSKNVTVIGSTIKGEYLGWYSENLKLINCTIIGTQPLCYCKNLVLENCKMINTDLAFEYSEINGSIDGENVTIKNPLKGKLISKKNFELIIDENDKSNGQFTLILE